MTRDEQAIYDAISDEAADYIEKRAADRIELRERYADVIGKNRYNNRDFEALVNSMFDGFDTMERHYARSNDRIGDWLPKAVMDMVDGHFANSVLSDRRTADELDNRTYNEMDDMAKLYKDLLGSRTRGRDRDRERGRGRDDRDDRDDRGRRGSGYSREPARTTGRDMGRERRDEGTGYRRKSSTASRVVAGDHWSELAESIEPRAQVVEPVKDTRRPVRDEPVIVPVAPKEVRPVLEGPDYTKPRPHDEFLRNGEHWMVASKAKWEMPFNYANPLASTPKIYDVRKDIKYLVKSTDGTVREELVKVTEDNRYLAHEALAAPERYRSEQTNRRSATISLRPAAVSEEDQLNPVKPTMKDTTLQTALSAIELTQFEIPSTGSYLGETLEGAVFNTRVKMAAENAPTRLNVCYKHTALTASSWLQEELVLKVFASVNLAQAAIQMRELKSEFDITIWNELNKRFSDLVLRAVRYQFQHIAVKTLSFANDWEALIAHLETARGEGFASDFAQRTAYIVPAACTIAARSDLGEFTDMPGTDIPCVVFMDMLGMICVDTTMDLLGLGNQLKVQESGASVTQTSDANLCTTIRSIYDKLDGKAVSSGACRVYFNTVDGQMVEIIPFAARKENFILALHK